MLPKRIEDEHDSPTLFKPRMPSEQKICKQLGYTIEKIITVWDGKEYPVKNKQGAK